MIFCYIIQIFKSTTNTLRKFKYKKVTTDPRTGMKRLCNNSQYKSKVMNL